MSKSNKPIQIDFLSGTIRKGTNVLLASKYNSFITTSVNHNKESLWLSDNFFDLQNWVSKYTNFGINPQPKMYISKIPDHDHNHNGYFYLLYMDNNTNQLRKIRPFTNKNKALIIVFEKSTLRMTQLYC